MKRERWASGGFKWVRIFGLIAGCFVLLAATGIVGLMMQFPIRALFWHCTHNSHVSVGSIRLTLPLLWWEERGTENGTIVLRHGKIDTKVALMTSELRLTPLKPGETTRDDKQAETLRDCMQGSLNGKSKPRWVPMTISAPLGKIYCTRDRSLPNFSMLFCFPARTPWKAFFDGGTVKEESDAESILATME